MSSDQALIRRSSRIADPTYRPLTHYSKVTSRPTTFHAFSRLPTEIQMKIFTLAAGTLDRGEVQEYLFIYDPIYRLFDRAFYPRPRMGYFPLGEDRWLDNGVGKKRKSMLLTCKLARLMTLEAWKREVGALDIGWASYALFPYHEQVARSEAHERKKQMLLGRVEELIGEVKGWMEGSRKMLALEQ